RVHQLSQVGLDSFKEVLGLLQWLSILQNEPEAPFGVDELITQAGKSLQRRLNNLWISAYRKGNMDLLSRLLKQHVVVPNLKGTMKLLRKMTEVNEGKSDLKELVAHIWYMHAEDEKTLPLEAIQDYTEAIRLQPTNPDYLNNRGLLYHHLQ